MKKTGIYFLTMVLLLLTTTATAQKYTLDRNESTVRWMGKKIGGEHFGMIALDRAQLELYGEKVIGGNFVIDMESMTNQDLENKEWNKKLMDHLKSPDFFDVVKYPEASFIIKSAEKKEDENYLMKGELTIKDITKPYAFEARVVKKEDGWLASGTMTIDRSDYNVKYGSKKFFKNLGDKLIYDDFTLEFRVLMKKMDE